MKFAKGFKNIKGNDGSILFIVLVVMTLLVALASAAFYTVASATKSVQTEYLNEQAYQAGTSVNELVYDKLSLGTGENELRQKALDLAVGASLPATVDASADGYKVVSMVITRVSRESFLLTTTVEKNGEIQTVDMTKTLDEIVKLGKVYLVPVTHGKDEFGNITSTMPSNISDCTVLGEYYEGEEVSVLYSDIVTAFGCGIVNFSDEKAPHFYDSLDVTANEYSAAATAAVTSDADKLTFHAPDGDVFLRVDCESGNTPGGGTPSATVYTVKYKITNPKTGVEYVINASISEGDQGKAMSLDAIKEYNGALKAAIANGDFANYKLKQWYSEADNTNVFAVGEQFAVSDNITLVADVIANNFGITISDTDNLNSFVSADKTTAAPGETVTLTIDETNAIISGLKYTTDGVNYTTITGGTFTMPGAPVTVTGNVTKLSTATLNPTENGSYTITAETKTSTETKTVSDTAASIEKVKQGSTVTIAPTPAVGYEIDTITVTSADGNVTVADNHDGTYGFEMPDKPINVTVTFKKIQYTVTPECNAMTNCTLTVNASSVAINANMGDTVTILATAAENVGAAITLLDENDNPLLGNDGVTPVLLTPVTTQFLDGVSEFTFVMPAKNVKVKCVFAAGKYNIFCYNPLSMDCPYIELKTLNGAITPIPNTANNRESVQMTQSPSEGYRISGYTYYKAKEFPAGTLSRYLLNSKTTVARDGQFTMPSSSIVVVGNFERADLITVNGEDYLENVENATVNAVSVSDKDGNDVAPYSVSTVGGETSVKLAVGDTVTFSAVPKTGYSPISGFTCNGNPATDNHDGTYTYTVQASDISDGNTAEKLAVVINSEKIDYTIGGWTENGNALNVTNSGSTAQIGDAVTLEAIAAAGYRFDPDMLTQLTVTNGTNTIVIPLSKQADDKTFTFTLTAEIIEALSDSAYHISLQNNPEATTAFIKTYTLTIVNPLSGVNVTKSVVDGGSLADTTETAFDENTVVYLKTDYTGAYKFTSGGSDLASGANGYEITMNSDKTVTVVYSKKLTVTMGTDLVSGELEGSATINNSVIKHAGDGKFENYYYTGENVKLVVTPGTGYRAKVVIVGASVKTNGGAATDGVNENVREETTYDIAIGNNNVTASVEFEVIPVYSITIAATIPKYAAYNSIDKIVNSAEAGSRLTLKLDNTTQNVNLLQKFVSGFIATDNSGATVTLNIKYYNSKGEEITANAEGYFDDFAFAEFEMPDCAITISPSLVTKLPSVFNTLFQSTATTNSANTTLQSQYIQGPLNVTGTATLACPYVCNSIFSDGDLQIYNGTYKPVEKYDVNVAGTLTYEGNSARGEGGQNGVNIFPTSGGAIRTLKDLKIKSYNRGIGYEDSRTDIYVLGDAYFGTEDAKSNMCMTVYGDIYVNGNLYTYGGLNVYGNVIVNGDLIYRDGTGGRQTTTITGNLYVNGKADSTGCTNKLIINGGFYAGNGITGTSFSYTNRIYTPQPWVEGSTGMQYDPSKTDNNEAFTVLNQISYYNHVNGYKELVENGVDYAALYPADAEKSSTRDIIYNTCILDKTTLWDPIAVGSVPDREIYVGTSGTSAGKKIYAPFVNSISTVSDGGKLYVNNTEGYLHAVVIDTTNGTPDPNDDKDIFLELMPNKGSDTFSWNNNQWGSVPTNVLVKGAGSVVFVLGTDSSGNPVKYQANTNDFTGHYGWLKEMNKNPCDWIPCSSGEISLTDCTNRIETLSEIYTRKLTAYDSSSELYALLSAEAKSEIAEKTYILSQCRINGAYKDITEIYGQSSSAVADDYKYLHNNIFLVSAVGGEVSLDASNPARFFGYIYTPKKTFNANGTQNVVIIIGGLIAKDYQITMSSGTIDKVSGATLYCCFTTPFDQFRSRDNTIIGSTLMGRLMQIKASE